MNVGQNVQTENNNANSEFVNASYNYEQMYESQIIPFIEKLNLNSMLTNKSKLPILKMYKKNRQNMKKVKFEESI